MRQLIAPARAPHRGVTLIELMMGLVITAVLLGVAAPFFGDYITNSRLREAGNSLLADALFAQSEALKRNGTVQLNITATQAAVIDTGAAPPVTLRTRVFGYGINATPIAATFGSDGMTRPLGTDVSADIAYGVTTCSYEMRCPRLRVEAGGSVRLCGNKLSCP